MTQGERRIYLICTMQKEMSQYRGILVQDAYLTGKLRFTDRHENIKKN